VDLGIVHLAVTSDGESYSGEQVEAKRAWYARRRQVLQSVGTRSAKRRLRQLSGRQRRYQSDTNHCISKGLVEVAQRTGRGIALEDLSGIGERTRVSREQRHRHGSTCPTRRRWSVWWCALRTLAIALKRAPCVGIVTGRVVGREMSLCVWSAGTLPLQTRMQHA
jgi:hypothetical protein